MEPSALCGYDGVKVFSATLVRRRETIGDDVNDWLNAHPNRIPVDTLIRQSSDRQFHCFTIVIFWRDATVAATDS